MNKEIFRLSSGK